MNFSEQNRINYFTAMENSHESVTGNALAENSRRRNPMNQSSYQQSIKSPLYWLELRVFYVRITKCEVNDSTPESLKLNHIPLNRDTLLELNGERTGIFSDGVSSLLKRDRMDKKSEEVTFVCTDSVRMTGSVKFEVFDGDLLVLSGELECNGFVGQSGNRGRRWRMNCEAVLVAGGGFLKGNRPEEGLESGSPRIEVCAAGCDVGTPIILSKTVKIRHRRKQMRKKGMLDSIPEYEPPDYPNYKYENEDYHHLLSVGPEFLEGEDGELSWFNAGVRVGVGIGLSVCLGVGIGVGLLVRTYQGTTRNFRKRLL